MNYWYAKHKYILRLLYFCIVVVATNIYGQLPSYQWGINTLNPIQGGPINVTACSTDNDGNIYLTGSFSYTADFDPSAATANLYTYYGSDVFLAKYDNNGNYIWSKQMGGILNSTGTCLSIGNNGDILLSGYFQGTIDLDPSVSNLDITSQGAEDIFIASYDGNGAINWGKSIGGTSVDISSIIKNDQNGNIILAGQFQGVSDFDPSISNYNLTNATGYYDSFFCKYDSLGNFLFANKISSTTDDKITGLAIDTNECIYITGYITNTADFDPSTFSTQNLNCSGPRELFIAKYSTQGNYIWANAPNCSGAETPYGICIDSSGNIVVSGAMSGGIVDFDFSSTVVNVPPTSSQFIAKYDSNCNFIWAKGIGAMSTGYITMPGLAIGTAGDIFICGNFSGSVDVDPSIVTNNIVSTSGSTDAFCSKYDVNGNFIFSKTIGGTNTDKYDLIAVDLNDNIILSSQFYETLDFNPDSGVDNLSVYGQATETDVFFSKLTSQGNYEWTKQIGIYSSIGLNENINDIVLDAYGNSFVIGAFSGIIDIDPSVDKVELFSNGGTDIFIAKYNAIGNLIWGQCFGGLQNDVGSEIELDSLGNVLITGNFASNVDFDPSISGVSLLTAVGTQDAYFAKYNINGDFIWAKAINGPYSETSKSISIARDGSIFIYGLYNNNTDFDPSPSSALINTGSGYMDIYIAKYDFNGNYVWAKGFANNNYNNTVNKLITDKDGNIFITGTFMNSMDMDFSSGTSFINSSGNVDAFFAKYDSNGNYIWAFSLGGTANDCTLNSICLDSNAVVVSGFVAGVVDMDPSSSVQNRGGDGNGTALLAKYTLLGNFMWAKNMGGNTVFNDVHIDKDDNIIVAGTLYNSSGDFNPSLDSVSNINSNGGYDIILAKYDSSGNYIWAFNIGSSSTDGGGSITTDFEGNILTSGVFFMSADFDPSNNVSLLEGNNGQDAYIVKYCNTAPNNPLINSLNSNLEICDNSKANLSVISAAFVNWYTDSIGGILLASNSLVYITPNLSDSTTYYVQAFNACGNSDRIPIKVNVNTMPIVTIQDGIICLGDTFVFMPNGADIYIYNDTNIVFPSQTTTYIIIGVNSNGCRDTTESTVFVNPLPIVNVNSGQICSGSEFLITPSGAVSYQINSNSYNVSPATTTTYTVIGIDSVGCKNTAQSIVTVFLPSYSTINVLSCYSYLSPSGIYNWNIDGVYQDTLTNVYGCDSIITINLSVIESTYDTISITTCEPYTSPSGLNNWNVSGTFHDTLTNANGCDSIITINLTILESKYDTLSVVGCETYTSPSGLYSWGVSGTYHDTLTNANGCDSILIISLTIINQTIDTSTTTNGTTLISNQNSAIYQWLDCSNLYSIIIGETFQFFTPDFNGFYAVEITFNGCKDTSSCLNLNTIDLAKYSREELMIIPNPSNGVFYFKSQKESIIKIYNLYGELIEEDKLSAGGQKEINLVERANGVYLVCVQFAGVIKHYKIIKEE